MSALDQAIIKAYAKDRHATTTPAAQPPLKQALPPPGVGANPARAAVEQLYRDGSLYRVEHAVQAATTTAARPIPHPHLLALPPTSPRRNVRRSVLRLLAAEAHAPANEEPAAPPRIARKVIIRHISHRTAPPPLGLRTDAENRAAKPPSLAPAFSPTADLPPEHLDDGIAPAPAPAPAPVAAPPVAQPIAVPLNIAWEPSPAIEIYGQWLHDAAIAPLVMLTDADAAKRHPAFAECLVHVDALAAAQAEAEALAADRWRSETPAATVTPVFHAKSLDEIEPPRPKIYIDAPHTAAMPRAHVRFRPERPGEGESAADPVAPEIEAPAEPISRESDASAEPLCDAPQPFQELAATADQALASDLIPSIPLDPIQPDAAPTPAAPEPSPEVRTAVPVWEVDRFQWPRTCEKLLADDSGYLASAGDKLLAAVQDGLKVLAITGTRRGEGRTTMALCLARAAAQAGVQVAIMDADFARPQIASKLGLESAHGWQDAALGKIPLSEAAIKSLADEITVLPLESSSVVRRLSLADPRVSATIRAVAATFELVILDLGPLQAGERLAFPPDEASPLDAAIVVRDVRFAGVFEGEAVGNMLQDLGVEAVGIAENFVIEDEIPATSV